jgi:arsenate reductase
VYGIKQCDTVKKACHWLEQHDAEFDFHDFRIDGLEYEQVARWLDLLGADILINRRSTTFRQLDNDTKDQLGEAPVDVLLQHPTLIKRPVLEHDTTVAVGFSDNQYRQIFSST